MREYGRRGVATIGVLVVSSDAALVEAIRLHLSESFPIEVRGVASSGQECVASMEEVAPSIVLIGEDLRDVPALQLSRQLLLARPNVATLILSPTVDVEYLQRASSAGARGVIRVTHSPEGWLVSGPELTTRIHQVNEFTRGHPTEIETRDARSGRRRAYTIVVYSPKGGVGKTVIATNLAAMIAQADLGRSVVLLDLNLQLGAIHALLDMQPEHSITDLVSIMEELNPTVFEERLAVKELGQGHKMSFLSAPLNPREADRITGSQVSGILASLRRYYDCLVVDTTSTVSDVTLAALRAADVILLVCTPDVLSISQVRTAIQLLTDPELGLDGGSISLVLNRVSDSSEIRPEDIEAIFDHPVIARIPEDYRFVQSHLNRGLLFVEGEGRDSHPIVVGLRQVARATGPPFARSTSDGEGPIARRHTLLGRLRS